MPWKRSKLMQRAFGRFIDSQVVTSTEPINIQPHQKEEHRLVTDDANSDDTPWIKFARFKNGTLELFQARTDSLEYIAFSHVWGKWSWRPIPGIPYDVKASQEKADLLRTIYQLSLGMAHSGWTR
jgi:hypothetical protein